MVGLLDLPSEALELIWAGVTANRDRRALRRVCTRSRALVDETVTAVWGRVARLVKRVKKRKGKPDRVYYEYEEDLTATPEDVSFLVGAPWRSLQTLDMAEGVLLHPSATLAAADWPLLQKLDLNRTQLDAAGVAALASARLPGLQSLDLSGNSLQAAGATALAAGQWPCLHTLVLAKAELDAAAAVALAAGPVSRRSIS